MNCYYCGEKMVLTKVLLEDWEDEDDDDDSDILSDAIHNACDSDEVQLRCTGCLASGPVCENADDCAEAFGLARQIITGTVDYARFKRYFEKEEKEGKSVTINDETETDDDEEEEEESEEETEEPVDDIRNPSYYADRGIQPMEVALLWRLNAPLASALKYICRAGHKPGAAYQDDITKAIRYLEMARSWGE